MGSSWIFFVGRDIAILGFVGAGRGAGVGANLRMPRRLRMASRVRISGDGVAGFSRAWRRV